MHDLHAANYLTKIVLEQAKISNLSKVTKIIIELGPVLEHNELIKPVNLRFNIKMLCRDTIAENAKVEILRTKDGHFKLIAIEGI